MKFLFNKKIIIILVSVVAVTVFSKIVFASWSGNFYEPGDTLNPECLPTDPNCDVRSPLTSILKAGTATAGTAPYKFTAGTNLSVTEAGAMEFDGSHLYFTIANAGPRYQLDQQATPSGGLAGDLQMNNGSSGFTASDLNDTANVIKYTTAQIWKPSADGTSALNFTYANGTTSLLNFDTTNGRVGIGTTSPTARLHLSASAGTAGSAPLKLTAGTNLSTTEAGAIEFDGSHLYFTVANSGSRYQIDRQSTLPGGLSVPGGVAGDLQMNDGASGFSASHLNDTANVIKYTTAQIWKPSADGTSALNFTYANGTTSLLNFDTTNGRIGIHGVTSSTAYLHLGAGVGGATTGSAPLKFTAGTNLSVTEAGAMEFDGSHLYFTIANAGPRYQLDQQATPSGGLAGDLQMNNGSSGFTASDLNDTANVIKYTTAQIWKPSADGTSAINFTKADGTTTMLSLNSTANTVRIANSDSARIYLGNQTVQPDSNTATHVYIGTQGYWYTQAYLNIGAVLLTSDLNQLSISSNLLFSSGNGLKSFNGTSGNTAALLFKTDAVGSISDYLYTTGVSWIKTPRLVLGGGYSPTTSTGMSTLQLDSGDATASNLKLTAGTTTGQTATDGFDLSIDTSGNGKLWNYENTALILGTNNANIWSVTGNTNTYTTAQIWKPSADGTGALNFTKANGTTSILNLDTTNGYVGIGIATPISPLHIVGSTAGNGSTTAIAGTFENLTFNPSAGGVQVGDRLVLNNTPTVSANTMAGQIIKTVDNTVLANLVRGIEVTSNAGSNTAGTNTGIRTTGATFGIQALTNGLAGAVSAPAAIYGENTGTTAGDILRLYSNSITSAPSVATFYHDTSTFTGTGLLMDFAKGSGTFSGDFIKLQNNNTIAFKVTSTGLTSVGLGSTASTTAVCSSLANTTSPTSGVSYELRDCSSAPAADYAEMYPVDSGIEFGDIVTTGSEMVMTYDTTDGNIDWNKEKGSVAKLIPSEKAYQSNVIGIVSNNYGDFSSTGNNIKKENNPMPVALSGRVPVKISNSSEAITAGDYVTTSNEKGRAMKALKRGQVIGKALENWSPNTGKDTVMIYIEQGYYDGTELSDRTFDGMTFFNADSQFMQNVKFDGQVEFNMPPIFNSDTAGFAIIKAGAKKVEVVFDKPYIAQPVVSAGITLEDSTGNIMTDDEAGQFFGENIESIVSNKTQNGFTIRINKNTTKDIKFSWTAFAVKNPKIFESIIPGLVIEVIPAGGGDVVTPESVPEVIPEVIPIPEITPVPEPVVEPVIPEVAPEPTPDPVPATESTQ